MRYLPLSDADRSEMLQSSAPARSTNCSATFPRRRGLNGPIEGLPMHASEMAVERHMTALARKNMVAGEVPFFLGCGAYRHHIPASVDHIIQRGEFLTSYTPYQPEIAQGTLQMLFEFQTQVARLLGCEVANASMYDGSTAMLGSDRHGATASRGGTRRSSHRASTRITSASPRRWRSSPRTSSRPRCPS